MSGILSFKWYEVAVHQSLLHENEKKRDTIFLLCIINKHGYRIYLHILNECINNGPSYIQIGTCRSVYVGVQLPIRGFAC
jgi:hypothetical protein